MVGCFASLFKTKHRQPPVAEEPAPATRRQEVPAYLTHEPCCGSSWESAKSSLDHQLPPYDSVRPGLASEFQQTIKQAIESYSAELQELSLWLSDHPELSYKEFKAHDKITSYLESKGGIDVAKSYKLPTAFKATYKHGKGGKTWGFNSEYDALPGIGHACGHNLIAVAGVSAFLGVKAALVKHDIAGTVVLIGTPAEEGGAGKVKLLEAGAYDGLDGCMMVHPGHSQAGSGGVTPSLAIQTIEVEYFGKTSHAAGAPWDGINALDAANIAYSSISAMRQQLKLTDRIHGIIVDGGQAANIIPEYTKMRYYARATTAAAVEDLKKKIIPCFEAAAQATGCNVKIWTDYMTNDLRNCRPLAEEYAAVMGSMYDTPVMTLFNDWSAGGGSTDFGNVTYALPACHPHFGIPFTPGRGNHTPEFTEKARSPRAHEEAFKAAVGMACVGFRLLTDKEFAQDTKSSWKEDMASTP
ncbi:hypothetical protein IAT38_005077 [Cryptococcus sp. DSM 104549]